MKLKVLGSGSTGNCYLLYLNDEILVLDCGLPIKSIVRGLNYQVGKVVGVLVTHSHQDHSLAVKDLKKMGIPVWTPFEDEKEIQAKKFGSFSVQCFPLPHDDVSNRGFLITAAGQKILYMTDFEFCKYTFKDINHMIIECNYQDEYINTDLANFTHKVKGHASLKTCLGFIEANKSNALRTVLAVHLGGQTCNSEEIVEQITKSVNQGVFVNYADKDLEIELRETDCPF